MCIVVNTLSFTFRSLQLDFTILIVFIVANKSFISYLLQIVFCDAESGTLCFLGYNHLYGHRHIKLYSHLDDTIAQLIREIRSDYYYIPGFEKCDLEYIVNYISTL